MNANKPSKTIIVDDPNINLSDKISGLSPSSKAIQAKAQEDARTIVLDGTPPSLQFQKVNADITDKNASTVAREAVKVDPKLNPAERYDRPPVMPSAPNNANLKINY